MGFFTNTCNHCGHTIAKAAGHCGSCGRPTATAWTWCRQCGAEVGADSAHCHSCGTSLQDQPGRLVSGDRLKLPAGWLAARLALRVPQRTFNHGFQVDHGTLALLKIDGKAVRVAEPGYHTFDTFGQRLIEQLTSNSGHGDTIEVTLHTTAAFHVNVAPVTTHDRNGLAATVETRVCLRIAEARSFDSHLMRARDALTEVDVALWLAPFVSQAVHDELRGQDVLELDRSTAVMTSARQAIADRLAVSMGEHGFSIGGIDISSLGGAAIGHLQKQRGDAALRAATQGIEQEAAVAKAEQQSFQAQVQHDLSERLRGIAHDARVSEQERKLALDLLAITGTDKIHDLQSKNRINELIRRAEEVRHETALNLARAAGHEDVIDLTTARKLERSKLKVIRALEIGDIARSHAQGISSGGAGAGGGRIEVVPTGRLDELSDLLAATSSDDIGSVFRALNKWGPGTTARSGGAQPPVPMPPGSLADGMRSWRRSVGMIVAVAADGTVLPVGTAWAWKSLRGIHAATNAHVAEAADLRRRDGCTIEWRLSGSTAPGLPVEAWRMHPIYRKTGSVVCGDHNGQFQSHDVALMRLGRGQAALDIRPLAVASATEVRGLYEGAEIAVWSCPSEGLVGNAFDSPQAFFHAGSVVGLSDYHFKPVRPGTEPHLIHHSIPTVGGSSGSPVFAMVGGEIKVVGLLCAGNAHMDIAQLIPSENGQATMAAIRVPSASQHNFAMPVSLLRSVPEP